jgi:hypothetical protein
MTHAKISFERPTAPELPRALPTALRKGAPTRRDQAQFVPDVQHVMITGVKIPFFSLVWQLSKLALAAIPAVLVFGVGLWGCIVLYTLLAPDLARWLTSLPWLPFGTR